MGNFKWYSIVGSQGGLPAARLRYLEEISGGLGLLSQIIHCNYNYKISLPNTVPIKRVVIETTGVCDVTMLHIMMS